MQKPNGLPHAMLLLGKLLQQARVRYMPHARFAAAVTAGPAHTAGQDLATSSGHAKGNAATDATRPLAADVASFTRACHVSLCG